jgi:hypothetical protein
VDFTWIIYHNITYKIFGISVFSCHLIKSKLLKGIILVFALILISQFFYFQTVSAYCNFNLWAIKFDICKLNILRINTCNNSWFTLIFTISYFHCITLLVIFQTIFSFNW